jgi:hypothetical protein
MIDPSYPANRGQTNIVDRNPRTSAIVSGAIGVIGSVLAVLAVLGFDVGGVCPEPERQTIVVEPGAS